MREQLAEQEATVTNLEKELAIARKRLAERRSLLERLREAGISEVPPDAPSTEWLQRLQRARADAEVDRAEIRDLIEIGEDLTLAVARAGEAARVDALSEEVSTIQKELVLKKQELLTRDQTGKVAQRMIEALRTSGRELVSDELKRITPLTQRIYSAIDPHPAFRNVNLSAKVFGGRGEVTASVSDTQRNVVSEQPGQVLSSSQVNALALSVFIALNIGSREVPLRSLILDDPLQSLDDINLLGLVDLLRRLRERRQLIISTHDSRFSSLLERKLRPLQDQGQTRIVEVGSWSRTGPELQVREMDRRPDMFVVA